MKDSGSLPPKGKRFVYVDHFYHATAKRVVYAKKGKKIRLTVSDKPYVPRRRPTPAEICPPPPEGDPAYDTPTRVSGVMRVGACAPDASLPDEADAPPDNDTGREKGNAPK